jgi:hypothetical protein
MTIKRDTRFQGAEYPARASSSPVHPLSRVANETGRKAISEDALALTTGWDPTFIVHTTHKTTPGDGLGRRWQWDPSSALNDANHIGSEPMGRWVAINDTTAAPGSLVLTGLQVTELSATPGSGDGEVKACNGYASAGDGGGGFFSWAAGAPVEAEDGALRINATGGQWVRIVDADLNVKWFGARGDGTPGDVPAFQACINAAIALGKRVFIPAGTFDFSTGTVTINGDVEIEGSGIYKTTIRASGSANQALLDLIVPYPVPAPGEFTSRHFRMRNLTLLGGGYGLRATGQLPEEPEPGDEVLTYMTNFSGLENVEFRNQTRACFETTDVSWLMCRFSNLDFAPVGGSPPTYGIYAIGYIPLQCAIFEACGFHYASGALVYGEDPFPPPAGTNQHTQFVGCTFQAASGHAVQLKSFGAKFIDCYFEQNGLGAASPKADVVLTTNYAGVAGRSPMDVYFLRPMFASPSPAQAVSGTYPRIKTVHPAGYGSSLLACKVEDAFCVNGYDHTWDIARDYSNGYMLVNSPGLRMVNTYATAPKRFGAGVVNPGRMVITDPTPQPVGYVDDSEYGSAELVLCTGSVGGVSNRWALYVINLPFDVTQPAGFSATLVAGTAGWVTFSVSGNRWRATTADGSHVALTRFSGAVT